ncbi:hypothetical protein [Nitrosococcus wardiae]|uniref:DUF2459 domain-containing protein n=1 Tax=Nitrosococcus wardiae TaxID=1814290 RepID=A0A4P7BYS7_9GAMM|nr:hypothetical protein [Nitrosococcus wardiae]QBQ55343.1 hypothetical protein E3U44_13110 [Nitrosococcus wardiae]
MRFKAIRLQTLYLVPFSLSRERKSLIIALIGVLLGGCANYVIPPKALEEQRRVFLLDHGRHPSLVLSRADSRLVRYAYGDWDYYARGKTGFLQGAAALLKPTTAALGRRELPGPPSAPAIRYQVKEGIESILMILVEADAVEQLQAALEAIYSENLNSLIYNADYDMEFVKHPQPYTLGHNSNQVMAKWLEELGCEVRGWNLSSHWRLQRPEAHRAHPTCG